MLKAKELSSYSEEALEKKSEEILAEIFSLKNRLKMERKLDQPHLLKQRKKERARVLTVLQQKRDKRV